mmetsp:Transcript_9296/g.37638  ORF Transcript_9296/g.37638 Transcript_9296/m.37638 type:complete len:212 (+) Transcript_9296:409-1044(+)
MERRGGRTDHASERVMFVILIIPRRAWARFASRGGSSVVPPPSRLRGRGAPRRRLVQQVQVHQPEVEHDERPRHPAPHHRPSSPQRHPVVQPQPLLADRRLPLLEPRVRVVRRSVSLVVSTNRAVRVTARKRIRSRSETPAAAAGRVEAAPVPRRASPPLGSGPSVVRPNLQARRRRLRRSLGVVCLEVPNLLEERHVVGVHLTGANLLGV